MNASCEVFFSVAPMIDWTDRHGRFFLRLLSRRALLYTEMIVTGAILHGDAHRHLEFHASENPVALQLGGNDPDALAKCAQLGQDYGYNEINLNVGCPSSRVQSGQFGACLMKQPELVADCIDRMGSRVSIPVTVKTRIGVDDHDDYERLYKFISLVSQAGCNRFIIHARKAWLNGLSPKENREIPPLCYDTVRALQKDFPALNFMLNGGIVSLESAKLHLDQDKFAGVMMGRAIIQNPYLLAQVDKIFYADTSPPVTREEVIEKYREYAHNAHQNGVPWTILWRLASNLYHACPGAKAWRQQVLSFR